MHATELNSHYLKMKILYTFLLCHNLTWLIILVIELVSMSKCMHWCHAWVLTMTPILWCLVDNGLCSCSTNNWCRPFDTPPLWCPTWTVSWHHILVLSWHHIFYSVKNTINRTSVWCLQQTKWKQLRIFLLVVLHAHILAAAAEICEHKSVVSVFDLSAMIIDSYVKLSTSAGLDPGIWKRGGS